MFKRKDWRHINRKNIQQKSSMTTLQLLKYKEVHWIYVRRKIETLCVHPRIELLYVSYALSDGVRARRIPSETAASGYARIINGGEDMCLETCHQNNLHKIVVAVELILIELYVPSLQYLGFQIIKTESQMLA